MLWFFETGLFTTEKSWSFLMHRSYLLDILARQIGRLEIRGVRDAVASNLSITVTNNVLVSRMRPLSQPMCLHGISPLDSFRWINRTRMPALRTVNYHEDFKIPAVDLFAYDDR